MVFLWTLCFTHCERCAKEEAVKRIWSKSHGSFSPCDNVETAVLPLQHRRPMNLCWKRDFALTRRDGNLVNRLSLSVELSHHVGCEHCRCRLRAATHHTLCAVVDSFSLGPVGRLARSDDDTNVLVGRTHDPTGSRWHWSVVGVVRYCALYGDDGGVPAAVGSVNVSSVTQAPPGLVWRGIHQISRACGGQVITEHLPWLNCSGFRRWIFWPVSEYVFSGSVVISRFM